MNIATTTFWKFLSDAGIEIPIIQRDYAQGRSGKEELRKSFLRDLKDALDRNEPMRLDFVYGTMESGKLIPLDGQQRLTTLWLLHWHIAYFAQELTGEVVNRLRKFTYETRISSRQFCEKLAGFSVLPPANMDVATHIKNQRWFRRVWRNDPTIRAMLKMISGTLEDKSDGIDGVFNSQQSKDYWKKLTSIDCPIVFYDLNLSGIAHSDDLYIKMNARGKPLTSFENFKADLAGYIEKSKNRSAEWRGLYDLRDGLPIRMDTKWMWLFWGNKSPVNTVDEAYFTFINRFFFNEVCLDKTDDGKWLVPSENENTNDSYKFLNDSRNGNDFDRRIAYTSLGPYKFHNGEIPLSALQSLRQTLDAFCDYMESCKDDKVRPNELIPKCEWDKGDREFKFFPEYTADDDRLNDNSGNEIRKVTILTQPQRVVFFATCKFFWELKHTGEIDFDDTKRKLEKWLRVVWNLVSVHDAEGKLVIREFGAMRTAMVFIKDLDSQNVYESLASKTWNGDSAFDYQCKEEIQKAKMIRNDVSGSNVWEKKIIMAENHAFFQGAIRFLFKDEKGNVNWSDFDTKYLNAKKYFDQKGVSQAFRTNALLLRAFLARIGESKINEKFWFGNGACFWRNQVLLNADFNSVVSQLLLSEVSHRNAICKDTPTWIADSTLLSDAIEKDHDSKGKNDPYGQWHIITDWFRKGDSDTTLTRYAKRIKGNVDYPWQIIPLCGSLRNKLLDELDSEQRRGDCYFIGWTSDIYFRYSNRCFQWYGSSGDGGFHIYLLKNDWKGQSNPYEQHPEDPAKQGDKRWYYCFRVEDNETKNGFRTELMGLIQCADEQMSLWRTRLLSALRRFGGVKRDKGTQSSPCSN